MITRVVGLVLAAMLSAAVAARAQMPDPRQMSGMPLPVGDVEPGTVTVRVLRGSFTSPVPSQSVELLGGPETLRATTNDIGRAEFKGLRPGTRVKAVATVGGERLESQEFAVPATGGIRLMLVSSDAAASGAPSTPDPAAPAPGGAAGPGSLAIGEESRFVFEMGEDGLSVFYIMQIVNSGASPLQSPAIVFDLPDDARGAALLQGSSPQAKVDGRRLTITGPFAAGPTLVQLAYTLPFSGAELDIQQKLPLPLSHVAAVAQKVGDLQMASPQIAEQRTMPAQGNLYIAGRGGPVASGEVLTFKFTGLPHAAAWPRNVAIGLAVVILAVGGWAAFGPRKSKDLESVERQALESRRDHLFNELMALEAQQREQSVDPERFTARRAELIASLERVYAALDGEAALERAS
jgi:hypothetical protein